MCETDFIPILFVQFIDVEVRDYHNFHHIFYTLLNSWTLIYNIATENMNEYTSNYFRIKKETETEIGS